MSKSSTESTCEHVTVHLTSHQPAFFLSPEVKIVLNRIRQVKDSQKNATATSNAVPLIAGLCSFQKGVPVQDHTLKVTLFFVYLVV
jgi:hypothetical protein